MRSIVCSVRAKLPAGCGPEWSQGLLAVSPRSVMVDDGLLDQKGKRGSQVACFVVLANVKGGWGTVFTACVYWGCDVWLRCRRGNPPPTQQRTPKHSKASPCALPPPPLPLVVPHPLSFPGGGGGPSLGQPKITSKRVVRSSAGAYAIYPTFLGSFAYDTPRYGTGCPTPCKIIILREKMIPQ